MILNIGTSLSLKKAITIYVVTSLFLIFEMAVQVSPSVMAPDLMRDLHMGTFALGLMSGFYFYTYTLMQIPSGLLHDRFKPKNIIAISILICSLGAALFGMSSHFYLGCLARMLMGFGSAFAFVSVLVVAADLFDKKHFPLLVGITQMLAAFGAMAGQFPISVVVGALGWRATMILLTGIGVVLAVIVWFLLDYEVTRKEPEHKNWMKDIKHDLSAIIKSSQTWYIAVYACLLWVPMSAFASLWGVPFLASFDQLSLNSAAFFSSMMWLGLALGSPLLGVFSNAVNDKIIPLWLSAIVGAFGFGMVLFFHLPGFLLGAGLFLAGAACSGQALSFAVVRDNNPQKLKAIAIAFNNMAVVISGALFQPIIGKIIENHQHAGDPQPYQQGCLLILGAYIIGFVLAKWVIKEQGTIKG